MPESLEHHPTHACSYPITNFKTRLKQASAGLFSYSVFRFAFCTKASRTSQKTTVRHLPGTLKMDVNSHLPMSGRVLKDFDHPRSSFTALLIQSANFLKEVCCQMLSASLSFSWDPGCGLMVA